MPVSHVAGIECRQDCSISLDFLASYYKVGHTAYNKQDNDGERTWSDCCRRILPSPRSTATGCHQHTGTHSSLQSTADTADGKIVSAAWPWRHSPRHVTATRFRTIKLNSHVLKSRAVCSYRSVSYILSYVLSDRLFLMISTTQIESIATRHQQQYSCSFCLIKLAVDRPRETRPKPRLNNFAPIERRYALWRRTLFACGIDAV